MQIWLYALLGFIGCSPAELPSKDLEEDSSQWHSDCPIDTLEERVLNVGDISLNVACRGAGPTVVFLHGFPEFHYAWKPVMDRLADEFRLVAPDQRGYNLSDKPSEVEAYALPLLSQDVLNLLPLVSPDPVLLVAHDWGGPVGWMVAHHTEAHIRGFVAANGPHPARFAHLIENDPDQAEASSYMDYFRMESAEQFITPEVLSADFEDLLSDEDLDIYFEAWSQPGAITGGLNWYRANELTTANIGAIMEDLSPTVSVPTVVMWGLEDEALLPANTEQLEPWVPNLQIETFTGVDHWIQHHIPEEIARVIRELDSDTAL
jgi:pimeloyl-ACP methyl ester carboxylesterase